jgi:hypothetical protein
MSEARRRAIVEACAECGVVLDSHRELPALIDRIGRLRG